MITKERPTVEELEKLLEQKGSQVDWEKIAHAVINTAIAIGSLYMLHVTYIHIWRMMTGH